MKATIRCWMGCAGLLVFVGVFSALASAQGMASSPGATLFKSKCAMCHGPDGAGKTMMGERLKVPDLRSEEVQKQTDEQLTEVINAGKAKMPAYKGKLTPEQVGQLVAEIRDMGKKK